MDEFNKDPFNEEKPPQQPQQQYQQPYQQNYNYNQQNINQQGYVPPQQEYYGYQPYMPYPQQPSQGMAIASLVLGIVSIFTYGMQKGIERLAAAEVKNISLTNFDIIAEVAAEEGYIKNEDIVKLISFRNNPSDESWINAGE